MRAVPQDGLAGPASVALGKFRWNRLRAESLGITMLADETYRVRRRPRVKTISVKLPDGVDARLSAEAQRRRVTKSAIVRAAIEDALARNGKARGGSALALAKGLAGCLSGPGDLSTSKARLAGFGRA